MTVQDLNTPLRCEECGREGSKGFQRTDTGLRCTSREVCDRRRRAAEAAANPVQCVDCRAEGVTTVRPIVSADDKKLAKFSGPGKPRCVTHARARRKATRLSQHATRVEKTYGITGEQYWALYEAQGGRCAICQVSSGKVKRLAVDHDHETGRVLGLLRGRCNVNRGIYGNEKLVRWIEYNLDPPAPKTIGDVFARFENMEFDEPDEEVPTTEPEEVQA